jgi:hypothetical protein
MYEPCLPRPFEMQGKWTAKIDSPTLQYQQDNEINKSDQKKKTTERAEELAAPDSQPPPAPCTNPSDGPSGSRELLFQLVQATNLLQLLKPQPQPQTSVAEDRGFTGNARTKEEGPHHSRTFGPRKSPYGTPPNLSMWCICSRHRRGAQPRHTSQRAKGR